MIKKILVMGLPGTGKTTFARELALNLNAVHFEADEVRKTWKDQNFSEAARLTQAQRMYDLCEIVTTTEYVIADFVCPTEKTRWIFDADFTVWMDTDNKDQPQYRNTNTIFEPPAECFHITEKDALHWAYELSHTIVGNEPKLWDNQKSTALMLGRYQPFHDGHKALFEEMIKRSPQVLVGVRDTEGTSKKDPLSFEEVKWRIHKALAEYKRKFKVLKVPNIENIFYGRDVGYNIERIELADNIEDISATEIRKKEGL